MMMEGPVNEMERPAPKKALFRWFRQWQSIAHGDFVSHEPCHSQALSDSVLYFLHFDVT